MYNILMNTLWEIYNEIGYKVKDITYLIPDDDKLKKKYDESKLLKNLKNVYIYNEDDKFYIINNGRIIIIKLSDNQTPHKSFFHKFVLDDEHSCNICYEKNRYNHSCMCGFKTCFKCFNKVDNCPQCRN